MVTLVEALGSDNGSVREEAATALGKLKAASAKEALIDLMTRSNGPDGEAARRALRTIFGVDFQVVE